LTLAAALPWLLTVGDPVVAVKEGLEEVSGEERVTEPKLPEEGGRDWVVDGESAKEGWEPEACCPSKTDSEAVKESTVEP